MAGGSRSGRPARPAPRRCPARGRRWPPGRAGRRPAAACSTMRRRARTGCRGGRPPASSPEALGQLVGHALGHLAGVDEDQGGAVLGTCPAMRSRTSANCPPLATASSSLRAARSPRRGRGGGRSRRWPAGAPASSRSAGARQQTGRRRRAAAAWPTARCAAGPPSPEVLEPLEAEGQVGSALVAGQGVDLVDDHGAHAAQHRAAAPRSAAGTATRAW